MKIKKTIVCIFCTCFILRCHANIEGIIKTDSLWTPIIYLSVIPDFENMNTMQSDMVIAKTPLRKDGTFIFNSSFLPENDHLYRIHVSKHGYPAASLIIGSDDENHFFIIANKYSKIIVGDSTTAPFLSDVYMQGYKPNQQFQQIRQWVKYADTVSYESHGIKREFIKKALSEKLLEAADTSQHPLVALYALSESNFQVHSILNPGFYQQFFNKWSKYSSSAYFVNFKQKLKISVENSNWWKVIISALVGILSGIFFYHLYLTYNKKPTDPNHELTIQERKILASLKEGKSNKELSHDFNIELSTVKSHINSIYSKLNIKSRKEIYKQ